MRLLTITFALVLSYCSAVFGEPIQIADLQRSTPVSFEKEILPIFRQSCLACHSDSEANGELVMETPDKLRVGGDSGAAIVPGNAAESLLLKLAAHQEESFMPPPDNDVNAPTLTSQQLGLLRLWINQGANAGSQSESPSPQQWKSIPKNLGPVYTAVISPDGQYVAASRANQLFIYHLASGRLVGTLVDSSLESPAAHRDLIQSLAWGRDSTMLASGGFREVKIWEKPLDARTGSFPTGSMTTALATSVDLKWLATARADHAIQLWNLETAQAGPKLTGHQDTITSLCFTPDGHRLISASLDKTIRSWNYVEESQAEVLDVPTPIHAIELVPSVSPTKDAPHPPQLLVAGGTDKVLRAWSVPSSDAPDSWSLLEPKEIGTHDDAITSLASIPGHPKQVYAASLDGTIRSWDLNEPKQLGSFNHEGPVFDIAVRSDGKRIASVSDNHTVRLWDDSGKQIAEMKGAPNAQQYSSRMKHALDAAEQRLTIVQQRLTAVEEVLKNRLAAKEVADMEVAAAVALIAEKNEALETVAAETSESEPTTEAPQPKGAPADDKSKLDTAEKELADAESAHQLALKRQTSEAVAVQASQTKVTTVKALVAQAEANKKDVQQRVDEAKQKAVASERPLRSVSFSPDGTNLATAGEYPTVQLWNAETGSALGELGESSTPLFPISFLDNDRLASSHGSTETVVWDVNPEWRIRRTIGSAKSGDLFADRITSLDINLEATRLLVGSGLPSRSGELSLIDLADGSLIHHLPKAHSDVVACARFSPDGHQIASAGTDKFVLLWNLNDEQPLKKFEGHSDYVLGVAWSEDAKSIVTVSSDRTIKTWTMETAEQSRTISNFGKDVTSTRFVGSSGNIISSCGDGIVRLQVASNGATTRTFNAGVWLHCVDATSDGQMVIAGGDNGRLFVWDGTNGKQLQAITVGQ